LGSQLEEIAHTLHELGRTELVLAPAAVGLDTPRASVAFTREDERAEAGPREVTRPIFMDIDPRTAGE
jgi:hypothetical protein